MLLIILKRIGLAIPLLLIVSFVTFVMQSLVPGDPARAYLGVAATPEQYEALRETLHLNEPIFVQYWIYLQNALSGDLGTSIFTNQEVLVTIAERLPTTLQLVIGSQIIATVVGILFGIMSATSGTFARRLSDVLGQLGSALPNFWVALVLISIFAVWLSWLPATGFVPLEFDVLLNLQSMILPWIALAVGGVAMIMKVTRDAMMTNLDRDFIRNLKASGIQKGSIVWRHGLRNSGISIVTVVGLAAISFIAGSILVENVFALPGLGSALVEATNKHDIPVIQGIALVYTLIVIVTNLLVDLTYGLLDPKLRAK